MKPLQMRKRLLIAESELNRVMLAQEYRALSHDIGQLTRQARKLSGIAAVIAALAGGFVAFRRRSQAPAASRSSWWPMLFKGLRFVLPLVASYRFKKTHWNGSKSGSEAGGPFPPDVLAGRHTG